MIEVWKDIEGYEGIYMVSNLGRVKSLGNKSNHKTDVILKQSTQRYKRVTLYDGVKRKSYMVHRLVAKAFIPNESNKSEVNHIDCDKFNNSVENLEWVTRQENHKHKCENGLNNTKNAVNKTKKKIVLVDEKGNILNTFESMSEASRLLNLSISNISRVCSGKLKDTKGYIFKIKGGIDND